jgi:hypothetical protein
VGRCKNYGMSYSNSLLLLLSSSSNYPDLHRHIFECAGNVAWLEDPKPPQKKKKGSKKKGFKRRLSGTPKKKNPDVSVNAILQL